MAVDLGLRKHRELRHTTQRYVVAWHLHGKRRRVVIETVVDRQARNGSQSVTSPGAVGGYLRRVGARLFATQHFVSVRFALLVRAGAAGVA